MRITAALILASLVAIAVGWSVAHCRDAGSSCPGTIRGQVLSANRPLSDCIVRIKASSEAVRTDADGWFQLPNDGSRKVHLTASKPGYYIGGCKAGVGGIIRIELQPYTCDDSEDYQWIDPRADASEPLRCGNCHEEIYREWSRNSHANSAVNPRFLNVYDGTDAHGNEDIGWNLFAEYRDGAGVCYPCHVPSLQPDVRKISDLREVGGVHRMGIHCDFCHKIADVSLTQLGLNHGRFAMRMHRPPDKKDQVFFGPLDDDDHGHSAYLPLYRQSGYCASCHEGILFGTHAYSTYSEWLASPQAKAGIHCQACHMAPTGRMHNVAPGHGGVPRDPTTLASHTLHGTAPEYLRSHLGLSVSVEQTQDRIQVFTAVEARDVGHCTPTGHPSRQLILWVHAFGHNAQPLEQIGGPVLPALAGSGPAEQGGLAGQPGRMYAKVLEDLNGNQPVPYWQVTRVAYDTRLLPDQTDRREFIFRKAKGASVRVKLLYRRFSKQVADEKGWKDNEILLKEMEWGG